MFVLLALLGVQLANQILIRRKGFEIPYTPTFIGGLPSEKYFSYVEQGMPMSEIRRKMLVALTKMQVEAQKKDENDTGEASA